MCNAKGMTTPAPSVPAPESTVPTFEVPAWAWMVVAAAAMAMYLVSLENGALLGSYAETLHEFFHDGRHFAAVPCH